MEQSKLDAKSCRFVGSKIIHHSPSQLILSSMQVKRVRCEASGVLVPKDKAVKRFIVRNIVDASAIRDIQDASVLEGALQVVLIHAPTVLANLLLRW